MTRPPPFLKRPAIWDRTMLEIPRAPKSEYFFDDKPTMHVPSERIPIFYSAAWFCIPEFVDPATEFRRARRFAAYCSAADRGIRCNRCGIGPDNRDPGDEDPSEPPLNALTPAPPAPRDASLDHEAARWAVPC